MTMTSDGETPRVHQIARALRDRIASGELQPGDQLPTIAQIMRDWNVAAATAQQALALLKRDAVITGGRGKPATVRIPPKRVVIETGQNQIMKDAVRLPEAERSRIGAAELTAGTPITETSFSAKYDTVPAPEDLAAELGVEPGTPLCRRTYETTDPGAVVMLLRSESYIPVALIEANPDLLDPALACWPGGHQHQLSTVGIEVDRFRNTVTAATTTADDRARWGIDLGVPLLRLRSRTIDTMGRVVEVSDSEYPADRTEIAWTEQLERWS